MSRQIDVEEVAASEEASRNVYNEMSAFRLKELELQLAHSNNGVLTELLKRDNLNPAEEKVKAALLENIEA